MAFGKDFLAYTWLAFILLCSGFSIAQVPVHEEPHHQNVIQDKYIRLLDVWIEPGDTTQFHVHSTPSLFTCMMDADIQWQDKGNWTSDTLKAGAILYNSFTPDKLVHRICNTGQDPYHVIDIELLSAYDSDHVIPDVPQPYPLIMDNEKVYVYQMNTSLLKDLQMVTPAPMIAILISGGPVTFINQMMGQSSEIQKGQFEYIDAGSFLSFSLDPESEITMYLVELK